MKILAACVKKASGADIVPKMKTDPIKKDPISPDEHKTNLTVSLAVVLPGLLEQVSAESDLIAALVEIPQYFQIQIYTDHGLEEVHLPYPPLPTFFSAFYAIA